MRRRERGAALLLVLAAVALLTVLAVELAARASADRLRAERADRDGSFRRIFDSGAEVTRGLLVERELGAVHHWGQSWNRELRFSLSRGEEALLRVSDESGKLNIARAITFPQEATPIKSSLLRLLTYLSRHGRKGSLSWRGAEKMILARLSSREPLTTLDGLREAGLEYSQVFGAEGLSQYLTCFGDGKINLNTAPAPVLAALHADFDDAMVERICRYRGGGDGKPGTYRAFETAEDLLLVEGIVNRSVGQDGQLRVVRNLLETVRNLVTVSSRCFSGRTQASIGGHWRESWTFFAPDGSRLAFEELLP